MRIGKLTICDYSDRSIAVQGEGTKEYKEIFKGMNGKFNPYLKGGKGWILSKKHKDLLVRRLTEAMKEETK